MKLKILFATIAVMFLISISSALATETWDLSGTYPIVLTCTSGCGGVWPHTMTVSIMNLGDGTFSGTGYYDGNPGITWVVVGTVTGDSLTMNIDYDANSYYVDLTGTIANDGSMSGTAGNQGQTFTWVTPAGAATKADSDGDGIPDDEDRCPRTIADSPDKGLGTNRWIWNEGEWQTKLPKGEGPQKSFTMEDTRGCSCTQILEGMGGKMTGHWKFGCSSSVVEDFIAGLPPLLVDTVLVYANDPTSTYSTITLGSGIEYELEAMGTVFAGDTIDFDAKYSITNRISGDTWTDSVSGYEAYGPTLLDLKVNGGFVDWGAYNTEHTYYYGVTGAGAALELLIDDIYYPNNVGFITVNIYELP